MPESFDSRYEALIKLLDDMIGLMREEQETLFLEWFEKDRVGIAAGKTRALQHLLAAYGGAGSINDILLQDGATQRRFEKLRSQIYTHAHAMLNELDEGGYYINR